MFSVCGGGTSTGGKVLGILIEGLTRVSLSVGRIGGCIFFLACVWDMFVGGGRGSKVLSQLVLGEILS